MANGMLPLLFLSLCFGSAAAKTSSGQNAGVSPLNYKIMTCSGMTSFQQARENTLCFASNVHVRPMSPEQKVKLFVPKINQARRNNFALSVSQSSKNVGNGQKQSTNKSDAKKQKNKSENKNAVKRSRMRKSEIDDLVRGIGLVPVKSANEKKKEAQSNMTANKKLNDIPTKQPQKKQIIAPSPSFSVLTQQSAISLETQLHYSRKGHAALRSFLPQNLIQQLRSELIPYAAKHALAAWRQKVEVQLADSSDTYHRQNARSIANNLGSIEECQEFLESLGMDPMADLPFLQHFNTWRTSVPSSNTPQCPTVTELCLAPYLAQTASTLLDCPTVRIYQDSLFHKRPGDGWTPWHSDARMAPFDTSKMITFWIPLQDVPSLEEGGTGLLFVDGSHSDFALPYWNGVDGREYDRLEERYGNRSDDIDGGVSNHMPLAMGDVTVHSGWTLHCAEAADLLRDGEDRYALAVTYVDGRAEVREDVLSWSKNDGSKGGGYGTKGDKEDVWSFRSWVEEVKPRSQFRSHLVPIVWPLRQGDD